MAGNWNTKTKQLEIKLEYIRIEIFDKRYIEVKIGWGEGYKNGSMFEQHGIKTHKDKDKIT